MLSLFWIALLLKALEWLIVWLLDLQAKGESLPDKQRAKLNHVLHKARELETVAVRLGCTPGGTPEE